MQSKQQYVKRKRQFIEGYWFYGQEYSPKQIIVLYTIMIWLYSDLWLFFNMLFLWTLSKILIAICELAENLYQTIEQITLFSSWLFDLLDIFMFRKTNFCWTGLLFQRFPGNCRKHTCIKNKIFIYWNIETFQVHNLGLYGTNIIDVQKS